MEHIKLLKERLVTLFGRYVDQIRELYEFYGMIYNYNEKSHVKSIGQIMYIGRSYLTQYLIKLHCIEVKKHVYDIEYMIHFNRYRIRVNYKHGPPPFDTFLTKDGTDITSDILPYMGPNQDFHGITYTPNDFGYEEIIVESENGDKRTFQKDESLLDLRP